MSHERKQGVNLPPCLQLRREKIDLENTLEQEQEMLVNKLWKRIEKVEQEKRYVPGHWSCDGHVTLSLQGVGGEARSHTPSLSVRQKQPRPPHLSYCATLRRG